ncbi:81b07b58-ac4d-4f9e-82db-47158a2c9e2e-CDS [Sclerotinia trifoliorum]|uniref:81b07b58-ac4d-4f9e-82db-47158a2c9e2e-CDS n=1 Tax=Sclerotinia trifoliorum TaxID=28548 RepID=A0A8H2W0L2_9HELO|nr:81b07b58-ac4d-4f9e-82db-47158a2c9e2e-CDS [Sclerotinia trifoliorum]
MNCQKGILPLYRRIIKSSNSPAITKLTKRSKGYKSEEPFVLPRVVIDLDAPENPAVRDYDATEDNILTPFQQQIVRSADKAIARRTKLVRKQLDEKLVGFPRKGGKKNQHIRDDALEHELAYNPDASPPTVTAVDLMTYALLGNPFTARGSKEPTHMRDVHMERLFMGHSIDFKDTANMTIRALTEDFDISTDGQGEENVKTEQNREIAGRRNKRKEELENEEQNIEKGE